MTIKQIFKFIFSVFIFVACVGIGYKTHFFTGLVLFAGIVGFGWLEEIDNKIEQRDERRHQNGNAD